MNKKEPCKESMYMARKKFFVPKEEYIRDYTSPFKEAWKYTFPCEYEIEFTDEE